MGGLLLVLVLVIVACLSAGVALAARLARARRPATVLVAWAALPAGVTRRTAGWRWAGVIGGLVAGGAAAGSGALGRGLLLAAPVFGLCVLAGVVVGETSVQSPGGRTRIAALEVRRVRDYLPRGLAGAVIAAAAVLLALLTVTTATGAPDDLGRPGRTLLLQCSAAWQQGAGPWPGSFYSVPLAAMVVAGLIAAGAALRVVVRRPRAGADPATVAADDALRHRAAQTITGACGILVALPLAGACLFTAGALLSVSCRPAWWTSAGWALLALLPALAALMGWCAVLLLTPARAVPGTLPAR
jgi:hypothetical protein